MASHDDADIRIRVGFLKHPKTRMLRRRLGSDGVIALLELWFFAAVVRPSGDLAGMTDEQVEAAAGWDGAPGALVAALATLAWLDGSSGAWRIHEWADYQEWVAARAARREAGRAGGRKSAEARAAKYGSARPNVGSHPANVGSHPGSHPPELASGFASGDAKHPFASANPHSHSHSQSSSSLSSKPPDGASGELVHPRGVVALPVASIDFEARRRAAADLKARRQAADRLRAGGGDHA